jgi:hypothetical protein
MCGPQCIIAVREWLEKRTIGSPYIAPGSPWQNTYKKRCNSIFRTPGWEAGHWHQGARPTFEPLVA